MIIATLTALFLIYAVYTSIKGFKLIFYFDTNYLFKECNKYLIVKNNSNINIYEDCEVFSFFLLLFFKEVDLKWLVIITFIQNL